MKLGAIVISHHKKFRRDLAQLVEMVDSCVDVISEVSTAQEAIGQVESLRPEVVLLDLGLAHVNALELTERIHFQWPETAVVVIGNEPAGDYRCLALAAGAVEYVDVLEIGSQLPAALMLVNRPDGCGEPEVDAVVSESADSARSSPVVNLRTRLRTAPTGPKHGPYTAWQYVHLGLALVLALANLHLQQTAGLGPERSLLLMLALSGIAVVEARQFARARHRANAPGHHLQQKGGAIAGHR